LFDRKDPQIEKEAITVIEGDGTWRDDVREALRRLGGRASLQDIYKEIEEIRRAAGRSIPRTLEAVVRRTLEENCQGTESYKGNHNLFDMPDGKGAGVWALRQ